MRKTFKKDFDKKPRFSSDRSHSENKFKDDDSSSDFRTWRKSSSDRRRPSGRRKTEWPNRSNQSNHVEMYKAVCDNCGAKCEVPFKPTPGKPVLCSECFKKSHGKNQDMEIINEKLDKIMKALSID